MAGWTNRGKFSNLDSWCRNNGAPASFYVALITVAIVPDADTNTMADVTEITAGNGYVSGGISVARNAVDFDVLTEDDVNDRALVQILDLVWTAAGGSIPSAGAGARYAVFTDDNGVVANREISAFWDLVAARTVTVGQTLTLQNCELRLTE